MRLRLIDYGGERGELSFKGGLIGRPIWSWQEEVLHIPCHDSKRSHNHFLLCLVCGYAEPTRRLPCPDENGRHIIDPKRNGVRNRSIISQYSCQAPIPLALVDLIYPGINVG